jgi:hypothetical protein
MSEYPTNYPTPRNNAPMIAALCAAVMLVLILVGGIVMLSMGKGLDDRSTPLVVTLLGVVVTSVPALISAAFSERASKDIRNGTLVAKSREGAAQALDERAPAIVKAATVEAIDESQVVTRTGPVVTAELLALTKILGHIDRLSEAPAQPHAAEPEARQ